MNAYHLAFPANTFDTVICGFMGWYDCFDFERREFTRPDLKGSEILRVLQSGGKFVCCSWEQQEDVTWMEEAMLRHYPQLLEDPEYLAERPIGMAYEKAVGYELILQSAGFREIEISKEEVTCISQDEQEWWRQMRQVGWDSILETIRRNNIERYIELKALIFEDLQRFMVGDGIQFLKVVFFLSGVK